MNHRIRKMFIKKAYLLVIMALILSNFSLLLAKEKTNKSESIRLYEEGLSFFKKSTRKNLLLATVKLEKSYSLDPNNPNTLAILSEIYASLTYIDWHFGNIRSGVDTEYISKALQLAKKAVQLDDKNYLSHRALGNAYLILAKTAEARIELEKANKLNENDALTWYYMAAAATGSYLDPDTKAGQYINKALGLNDKLYWALSDKLMMNCIHGKIDDAKALLAKLKVNYSDAPLTIFFDGLIKVYENNLEGAKTKFEEYVEADKDSKLAGYLEQFLK